MFIPIGVLIIILVFSIDWIIKDDYRRNGEHYRYQKQVRKLEHERQMKAYNEWFNNSSFWKRFWESKRPTDF